MQTDKPFKIRYRFKMQKRWRYRLFKSSAGANRKLRTLLQDKRVRIAYMEEQQ